MPIGGHAPRVPPLTPSSRTFRAGAVLAVLVCVLAGSFAFAPGGDSDATGSVAPDLGLLQATTPNFASEAAAGVDSVTIPVAWSTAEATRGVFSSSYIQQILTEIAAARSAGLEVVLDPGLQYTPNWVFSLPGGTRFVNQYGDVYTGPGASGNNVANAVTDTSVRSAQGYYLHWLGTQIPPGSLIAVRQGGGPLGEIRYPDAVYDGDTNSYWAYDASTQAGLVSSVRGWVPGTGTPAQATTFLGAYNENLINYSVWLNGQLRTDFATRELLLLPGWGQRPGAATAVEAALLAPSTSGDAEKYSEYNEGLDWNDLLHALPDPSHSVAYTTYLDAQTVLPTPQLEDPADFLASLVAGTPILLGGENTGTGTLATMQFCMAQALRLNFFIADWMGEPQLLATAAGTDPAGPTLAQLGAAFSGVTSPVTAPPPTFAPTVVGQSTSQTLTVTAQSPVIVQSLAATGPFALGAPSAALPVSLPAGGSITVPVTFDPVVAGPTGGTVTVATAGARQAVVNLSATGENLGPSLSDTTGALSYTGVEPGGQSTSTVGFVNLGSGPVTVASVTLPSTPFVVTGAPVAGQVIQPGAQVTASVSFAPSAVGQFTDSLTVVSDGGSQQVALTGTATPPSLLEITPLSLAYGSVRLGESSAQSFQVSNVGGSTLTITQSQPPMLGEFTATSSLPVGTTLAAGTSLVETVAFAPNDVGSMGDQWVIAADDGQGSQTVAFSGSGVIGDPSLRGWAYDGTTVVATNGELHLTSGAALNQAGSSFWPTPVSSAYLAVSFTSFIGSGTGGNGTAFVLADASDSPTSVGASGAGLGFSGIPGVAVALDTEQDPGNPSANFVGVTDGPLSGQGQPELHWLSTNSAVRSLLGPDQVGIVLDAGVLTVTIDGTQVIDQSVTVGPKVLVGFTGSTGALTDIHSVSNVSISGS